MNEDQLFGGLTRFGMTPYEIKVYKSLLIYGPQTSMGIVKKSGIPQPRVYDVCNNLLRKGFIEISPGRVKIYRAVPISSSLRRQIDDLTSLVDDLEEHLENLKQEKKSDIPYLWLIENEKNIVEMISNMITSARDELILSISSSHFKKLHREISIASEKGVTIAMVVFSDTGKSEINTLPKGIILKKRDAKAAEIAISDRRAAMVNMSIINKATPYAVYIQEDELLHMIGYYFLTMIWSPSNFIQGFTERRSRTFRTGWMACEAIQAYLDSGMQLTGTLEGISNDKDVSMTGRITGTDRIDGVKYSFFIEHAGRNYSVGGKTATLEDISMLRLQLACDAGPQTS